MRRGRGMDRIDKCLEASFFGHCAGLATRGRPQGLQPYMRLFLRIGSEGEEKLAAISSAADHD
jgi:hypothetical protein